jgi:hypothetical protein
VSIKPISSTRKTIIFGGGEYSVLVDQELEATNTKAANREYAMRDLIRCISFGLGG